MDQLETDRIDDELTPDNPEDVAVLYSWAKLQGAKYRDFSASRRAYRAQLRHRAAEATGAAEFEAQVEAETTAAETERAAREAEEAARRHEMAARRALDSQAGRDAVAEQEAASERAMLAAAELARKASMARIEAARRAEAVVAAEAAAKREEQEMAAAHASAQRQAQQYAESERRQRRLAGPQPDDADFSDPYEADQASARPDRMYHHQPAAALEEDMRPARYRSSRDNGRVIVTQPDRSDDRAPQVYEAPANRMQAAEVAAAGVQTGPPAPFVERRARPRTPAGIILEPTQAPVPAPPPAASLTSTEATVSEPPQRLSEAEINYNRARMNESRAKREAYAASIAPPLAGRLSSGIRLPQPRTEARPSPQEAAPSPVSTAPDPQMGADRRKTTIPDFVPEQRDASRPDRRSRPRPDFSNATVRPMRPDAEEEMLEARAPRRQPLPPQETREDFDTPPPPSVRSESRYELDPPPSSETQRAGYQEQESELSVPAWLYNQPSDPPTRPAVKAVVPPAPLPPVSPVDDTLQQSRERVASRWFALKGVFEQGHGEPEMGRPRDTRPPVLTVYSLAGGVGKTSLIATMGRALSAVGERVLLTDTTSAGLLPFYFGASELRDGAVRTFTPPEGSADAPISLVSYDVMTRTHEAGSKDWFMEEVAAKSRGMQRVLVDLGHDLAWVARRLARMNSTMLVPVAPDMNSVISLQGVERFFSGMADSEGRPLRPLYVLNQFDASLPLHLDVREVMRQQLGDRLLPFVIRRSPAVAEALAEGMTVMDYAPDSPVAVDYSNLVAWLRAQAAPAAAGFRNARWSER